MLSFLRKRVPSLFSEKSVTYLKNKRKKRKKEKRVYSNQEDDADRMCREEYIKNLNNRWSNMY